jgi:hypothetical protein
VIHYLHHAKKLAPALGQCDMNCHAAYGYFSQLEKTEIKNRNHQMNNKKADSMACFLFRMKNQISSSPFFLACCVSL